MEGENDAITLNFFKYIWIFLACAFFGKMKPEDLKQNDSFFSTWRRRNLYHEDIFKVHNFKYKNIELQVLKYIFISSLKKIIFLMPFLVVFRKTFKLLDFFKGLSRRELTLLKSYQRIRYNVFQIVFDNYTKHHLYYNSVA